MDSLIEILSSDYAIILYESIAIVATIICGCIYSKRIKNLQSKQEHYNEKEMYNQLDSAIENAKRRKT